MALEDDFDWLAGLRAAQRRFPALVEDEHVKAALAEVGSLVIACHAGTMATQQLLFMFPLLIVIVQQFSQGKRVHAPCALLTSFAMWLPWSEPQGSPCSENHQ